MEEFEDMETIAKLNEMRMHLEIVYLSEVHSSMYAHKIKFLPVEMKNSLTFHWNKFKQKVQ